MNDRIKRFNVGDVVIDRNGRKGQIQEAHCDPHPREFAHCSGNSARYLVNFENPPSPCTRWDWQLSLWTSNPSASTKPETTPAA